MGSARRPDRGDREHWKVALDGSRHGVFDWDIAGGRLYQSATLCRIVGLGDGARVEPFEACIERVHPADRDRFREGMLAHFRGETPYHEIEFRSLKPGGGEVWIEGCGTVVERDESGEPTRMIGVFRDITPADTIVGHQEDDPTAVARLLGDLSRAQAENARLHETSANLRLAIEAARLGVFSRRLPDGPIDCSATALAIWGQPSGTPMTTAYLESLIHADDRARVRAAITSAATSGQDYDLEYRVLWPDGTVHWVEAMARVFLAPDGHPELVRGMIRDVTAEKQAELELRAAKDTAESASRAKNAFLGSISHELRTPLNAIIGFSGLMLDGAMGEVPTALRRPLEMVRRAGQELHDTVRQILDLTSIEGGNVSIDASPVPLRALLDEVHGSFAAPVASRGLILRPLECDTTLTVFADGPRLAQVTRNLVSNALKFTDQGSVWLVAARQGGFARIEVGDTGIGIPRDQQHRLFEPFQRITDEPGRLRQGTGIGLSVCRRIVAAMGGEIGVESEPGRGSRFWFTVPLAPGADGP